MDPKAALAGPRRWLAVALVAAGCAPATPQRAGAPLRVLAAASLTEVIEELAAGFESPVETSFGASSALARQIRDGAPADVFVSASPEWTDFLADAGALDGAPVVLARNHLVAIAAPGSGLVASDPRALLTALGGRGRVGIADPGVPAGEYARVALESAGLAEAYRPRLVGQRDVRAVLAAVERRELEAGFVYATDALVAPVAILFTFDDAGHPPIEYRAAVLRSARDPEGARRFLDHLQKPGARASLRDAGFEVP